VQTHIKLFALILSLFIASQAAGKKQNSSSIVQPVNLAVSFETLGKNKQVLNTISFDGEQKTLIVGNVNNTTEFKCDTSGQFEIVMVGVEQYVAAFLEFSCGQNDQKIKSKVGRFLIPVKDYQSFLKIVFLHKDQPEAVLKIKELSL
jgi:hypothetical protein